MTRIEQSIFNLIEIFRFSPRSATNTIVGADHCEKRYHHDFYCDAEKPFVSKL